MQRVQIRKELVGVIVRLGGRATSLGYVLGILNEAGLKNVDEVVEAIGDVCVVNVGAGVELDGGLNQHDAVLAVRRIVRRHFIFF